MSEHSFAARTKRYQFPNGLTLLVLENHANPTVSVSGYLRAGAYFNPDDKAGLSSITASMLNKGTARRSKLEIAEELESAGARLSTGSNTFTVSISGQSLSRDLPLIISTLGEELREPTFPADELDKLKQRVIAGIKEDQDETRVRAYERLTQLIFSQDNPFYRKPAEQLINRIEAISTDDLQQFYSRYYGPGSMILAIVGDVEAEKVRGLIEEVFGSWQGAQAPAFALAETPLQGEAKIDFVQMRDKANCDVVIGHASRLRRSNSDYLAARIANSALGQSTLSSRLGLKVRDEMGLTYGINSSFPESGIGDGPFTIAVTVAPQNIDQAIKTTMEIVSDYLTNGIREDELRDEKSSHTGAFKVGLATNSGMASQIASAELLNLGVNYLDEFPSQIASLTKAQVDQAIRKYLHPEVATTVIAGTIDKG
jgi:zinc protease